MPDLNSLLAPGHLFEYIVDELGHDLGVFAHITGVSADIPEHLLGIIAALKQLFRIGSGELKYANVTSLNLAKCLGLHKGFQE